MDDVIEEKEGPKLLPASIPQKDEFSRFIPIYINEPFSLALMATFAVIIQQCKLVYMIDYSDRYTSINGSNWTAIL